MYSVKQPQQHSCTAWQPSACIIGCQVLEAKSASQYGDWTTAQAEQGIKQRLPSNPHFIADAAAWPRQETLSAACLTEPPLHSGKSSNQSCDPRPSSPGPIAQPPSCGSSPSPPATVYDANECTQTEPAQTSPRQACALHAISSTGAPGRGRPQKRKTHS